MLMLRHHLWTCFLALAVLILQVTSSWAGIGMAESAPTLLDTHPPLLQLEDVPENLTLRAGETHLFQWNAFDQNPGEDSEDFLATVFDQGQTLEIISWYPEVTGHQWDWVAPEVQSGQVHLEVTIRDIMGNTTTATTSPFTVLFSTTEVAEIPAALHLGPAVPNPFNPSCQFQFSLAQAGQAEFVVHDLRGRRLRTLHRGILSAGTHTLHWDGTDKTGRPQPGGLYLFVMTVDGPEGRQKLTRQAILIP